MTNGRSEGVVLVLLLELVLDHCRWKGVMTDEFGEMCWQEVREVWVFAE
jgi:hypothetical protein